MLHDNSTKNSRKFEQGHLSGNLKIAKALSTTNLSPRSITERPRRLGLTIALVLKNGLERRVEVVADGV